MHEYSPGLPAIAEQLPLSAGKVMVAPETPAKALEPSRTCKTKEVLVGRMEMMTSELRREVIDAVA